MITEANEIVITEPFSKVNTALKTSQFYRSKFKCGYQTKLLNTIYAYDENGRIYPIDIFKDPRAIDGNVSGLFDVKDKKYLIYVTNKGTVKKSLLIEYNGFKRSGLMGKLREGEHIIYANAVTDEEYLLMLSCQIIMLMIILLLVYLHYLIMIII